MLLPDATINNMAAGSFMCWVYPTGDFNSGPSTGNSQYYIVSKQVANVSPLFDVWLELGDDTILVVIPRVLQLLYRTNTGAAFSILQAHPLPLKIFSTVVVIVLVGWSIRLHGRDQKLRLPLGFILGGATGNLIDRYFRGHVIDFIDAHWDDVYHFPTFNVADSSICIGVGLLMLMILTGGADPDEAGAQSESQD